MPRAAIALPALLLIPLLAACSSQAMYDSEAPAAMKAEPAADGFGPSETSADDAGVVARSAAPLRAGSIDDNVKWTEYQQYLARYRGEEVLHVDVSERVMLHVIDRHERPIPGATLIVRAGDEVVARLRTYADGRSVLFPRARAGLEGVTHFEVEAKAGQLTTTKRVARGVREDWTLILPGVVKKTPPKLELVFCLDATGSMGDEIARIQSTLTQVTRRIQGLPGAPSVRWGLVAYRDRGDDFVTRRWRLTSSLEGFNKRLMQVSAAGGNDYREALNAGVQRAVRDMDWSDPDALRLVFLVADAPPQLDRQDVVPYTRTIEQARELGVKIYPIAASGLDAAGEYVFRQLAQQTLASFVFISYGGTTSHQVGPYVENNLDSLIVGIVRRELGLRNARKTRTPRGQGQPARPFAMPNGE